MDTRLLAVLVGSALVLGAASAQAAKIVGRVSGYEWLESPTLMRARDPANYAFSFREPTPSVPARFRRPFPAITKELCVALLGAEAQAPAPKRVYVSGGRTTPTMLVVSPGSALEFKNVDPFEHRLFGVGLESFRATETADGGSRQWTVPAAGLVEIRDEVTTSLQTWVAIEPNVVTTAYPDLAGTFTLAHEAPGAYKIQVYFAGKPVGPAVEVTLAARDIDLRAAPLVVATEKKSKN